MPNIGRTETEAMLAGVGRNHPNDHFLQIPRVDNVARCYVCELVPGPKNAMLDFTGVSKKDMGLTPCRLDLFMDFPLFADDVHNYVKSLAWIFSLPD